MKKFFVILISFCLVFVFSFSAFAESVYQRFTPTVYGSVSPTSSYVSLLYGYVLNYEGKAPLYWVIVRTASSEYTMYYSFNRDGLVECPYVVYHSSSSYSGDVFTSGELPAGYELSSLKDFPREYSYVGNVEYSCAYSGDYSSSQFDYHFVLLCLIAVLFIVLLFRRGYPGRCSF